MGAMKRTGSDRTRASVLLMGRAMGGIQRMRKIDDGPAMHCPAARLAEQTTDYFAVTLISCWQVCQSKDANILSNTHNGYFLLRNLDGARVVSISKAMTSKLSRCFFFCRSSTALANAGCSDRLCA